MHSVPTTAARKLALKLGVDVDALTPTEGNVIGVGDVEKAAAAKAPPAAAAVRTAATKKKKPAKTKKPVAPSNFGAPTPVNDPLFLDGRTIRITWKKGRRLVGKVKYCAHKSRPRIGKERGRTKYLIFFEGRKSESVGACTSWNRLKARKFEVVKSPQEAIKGRHWSEAEEDAVVRRHRAGESQHSMARSFGRTESGINNKYQALTNKNYASKAGGHGARTTDMSINWRQEVARALKQLPGSRGTAHMVCNEIEKMGVLKDHHREKAPGQTEPKWHKRVAYALSQSREFEKTDEKQAGANGMMAPVHVWAYHPDRAAPEPEDWGPDGKPREHKRKWLNAKERRSGYDAVHQNNGS